MNTDNLTALRLRRCREESHETLEQIGLLTGVNKSTVMRWERGETSKINLPTLHLLARHFGVSAQWLLGHSDVMEPTHSTPANVVPVPIMGAVRAGYGGLVFEELSGSEPVDMSMLRGGDEFFWLRVTGDSMTPAIDEGDLVLVRRQESVDSGKLAVVLVDGEEGLVKRVIYTPDWLELHSFNPYYPPRRFEGAQMSRVTVVGLVVESKRKYI